MIKKVDHVVITTNCIDKCLSFYETLGFSVQRDGARYALFAGDFKINVHIRGRELEPHAGHVQPGSADLCFETEGSLDELKGYLEKSGLAVELGIVGRTGVRGPMQSLYLRDPDGNLVELCRYDGGEE